MPYLPVASLENPYTPSALNSLMQLWNSVVLERLQKLLTKEGNIVDTARNMIALTPTLRYDDSVDLG